MYEFGESWFFGLFEVLVKMHLKILGPERFVFEMSCFSSQSAFLEINKLKYLVEELITCHFPEFWKAVSIIVQFRIANSKAPAFEYFRHLKLQLQALVVGPLKISAYLFQVFAISELGAI